MTDPRQEAIFKRIAKKIDESIKPSDLTEEEQEELARAKRNQKIMEQQETEML